MTDCIKLILMSCCAPCSSGAIKQLANGDFPDISDFIVMFYNPNIYPITEYQKRLDEQIKYCQSLGVKYVVGEYDHENWLKSVHGLESQPERGERCSKCFAHRFKYACDWAKKNGYNAVTSVFGVSRHKSQSQVDNCGQQTPDIKYISLNFDENLRTKINSEFDFYRQNYCGCEFSFRPV